MLKMTKVPDFPGAFDFLRSACSLGIPHIYIYIYIYMAITSINGPKGRQNFNFSPVLLQKMTQKKPAPIVGVFHVSMVCLLSHLCLFLP